MNSLMKRGLKIVEDGVLLKILQSEIRHEISHPRFQVIVSSIFVFLVCVSVKPQLSSRSMELNTTSIRLCQFTTLCFWVLKTRMKSGELAVWIA